jgi:alkylation response protein AidB-like acyl-CoA dehydrogenase
MSAPPSIAATAATPESPHETRPEKDASRLLSLGAVRDEGAPVLVARVSSLADSDPASAQGLAASLLAEGLLALAGAAASGQGEAGLSWSPSLSVEQQLEVGRADPGGGRRIRGRQRYVLPPGAGRLVVVAAGGPSPAPKITLSLALDDDRMRLTDDVPSFAEHAAARGFVTIDGRFAAGELHDLPDEIEAPDHRLGLLRELLHAAVGHGILRGFLQKACDHLRTRSRPWPDSGVERAADDPHVLRRLGEYMALVNALSEMLSAAAAAQPLHGRALPEVALQTIAARLAAVRIGTDVINGTIELLGASAASSRLGFDGYWRDLTEHVLAEPPFGGPEALGAALLDAARERANEEAADRSGQNGGGSR